MLTGPCWHCSIIQVFAELDIYIFYNIRASVQGFMGVMKHIKMNTESNKKTV